MNTRKKQVNEHDAKRKKLFESISINERFLGIAGLNTIGTPVGLNPIKENVLSLLKNNEYILQFDYDGETFFIAQNDRIYNILDSSGYRLDNQDYSMALKTGVKLLNKNKSKHTGRKLQIREIAEIKWDAVENAMVKFLKSNAKVLEKAVKARDEEKTKIIAAGIVHGLAQATNSLLGVDTRKTLNKYMGEGV